MDPERSKKVDRAAEEMEGLALLVDGFVQQSAAHLPTTIKVVKDSKQDFGMRIDKDTLALQECRRDGPADRAGASRHLGSVLRAVNGTPVTAIGEIVSMMSGNEATLTFGPKGQEAPTRHVDPTASEEEEAKRLLAELVQLKRDNNSQTECLLHWVDKYQDFNTALEEEARLLEEEVKQQQITNKQLLGLKRNQESSTLTTVSNLIDFTGT